MKTLSPLFICLTLTGLRLPAQDLLPRLEPLLNPTQLDTVVETATGQQEKHAAQPFPNKKILEVTGYTLHVGNWQVSSASRLTRSTTLIQLTGRPSRNSDTNLRSAFLNFVSADERLPAPRYSESAGRIDLYFRHENLNAVLAALHQHEEIYCWIGFYERGHIYGDLHVGRQFTIPEGVAP